MTRRERAGRRLLRIVSKGIAGVGERLSPRPTHRRRHHRMSLRNRRANFFGRDGAIATTVSLGTLLGLALLAGHARAETPPDLPPEAYSACESKSQGDACTVQFRNEAHNGTCAPAPSGDGRLFCRLERPPQPHEFDGEP
jgi:hypothetical protein